MATMILGKAYIVTVNPQTPSVADAIGCRVYWSQRGAQMAAANLRADFQACKLTEPTVVRVYEVAEGYTVNDRGVVRQAVR